MNAIAFAAETVDALGTRYHGEFEIFNIFTLIVFSIEYLLRLWSAVELKEGDFFSEMALLERRRLKHDVVAKTRCKVYVLDSQSLSRLARRHPEILQRIRAVAAARSAGEGRQRKPRAAKRGKQDEPRAF